MIEAKKIVSEQLIQYIDEDLSGHDDDNNSVDKEILS